ncbi:death domain-containing protein 1 [Salvelinus fontinalis]|uniref:death domain-containing protein 1 n=1 Tax=Salvelinus fontinalis TaxID=8038 RepID=UPI002484EDF4|nr:death domain-containing protein 1 [Salvelinus fontinalis]
MRPSFLTTLGEEVEDSVLRTMVSIVLKRPRENPHMALVAALPSRDLSWKQCKLRARGYCGLPEPSLEIPMCEVEQLLLSFIGKINQSYMTTQENKVVRNVRSQSSQHDGWGVCERITFHSQRKNRLHLRLTEVDPFGNNSTPHYKGMAVFHKITRDQLEWREDKAVSYNNLSSPPHPLFDSTLYWLSEELSEEDAALLVLSFRLRCSSIQLVRLQAPDSLAAQAYHVIGLWRRGLPATPHSA